MMRDNHSYSENDNGYVETTRQHCHALDNLSDITEKPTRSRSCEEKYMHHAQRLQHERECRSSWYSSDHHRSLYSGNHHHETDGDSSQQFQYSPLEPLSRRGTLGSYVLADSTAEAIVEDLQSENEPTSALLGYCKRKFLRPFVKILTIVGLNPFMTDLSIWQVYFGYCHASIILCFLLFNYALQYVCGYRRDRGFANQNDISPSGTVWQLLFSHIFPNTLHFFGYISAVVVFKVLDQEQLQNLVERVFLSSMKPRRLCRMLWLYVFCALLLFGLLCAYVSSSVLARINIIQVKWLAEGLEDCQLLIKIILLLSIFVQDLMEIIILCSYCIECYLLRMHLLTLSHKLIMHSVETLDWMREIMEFRKLLDHLNERIAVPVSFFIVMNFAYAIAGLIYFLGNLNFHYSAVKILCFNLASVLMWLSLGLLPFCFAASVTSECQSAQAIGHQIRIRPFVYHSAPDDDLNTTLLFASTLNMSAKLFRMPVQPSFLCFGLFCVSVVVLTLGMCLNFF